MQADYLGGSKKGVGSTLRAQFYPEIKSVWSKADPT